MTRAPPLLAIVVRFGLVVALLAACLFPGLAALAQDVKVTAARIWPAPDYTRITIESAAPLKYNLIYVPNPDRLVLDLEGVAGGAELEALAAKISVADPYINAIRVGRFKPGVLRVVLDLKTEAAPQVFTLRPIAAYSHRLVLDVYPVNAPDPLMALVARSERAQETTPRVPTPAEPETPATVPNLVLKSHEEAIKEERDRKEKPVAAAKKGRTEPLRSVLIAIDAGHGGEDPGARGRNGTYEKDITLAIARRLKARLDDEPGMRGVLIRDGDYFIPLQTRVHKARKVQADLFVSIHADAFIEPRARGSSVFALSERGATFGCRELAREARERGGSDRRREHRRSRLLPQENAARPAADRDQQRQPKARAQRAVRAGGDQHAAQNRSGTGRLRSAQGAGHPLDPGRDRVHHQP